MDYQVLLDTELLSRFMLGQDRRALEELFGRHSALAYQVALRLLGNSADAEDAAQQAFLDLLRYAPKLRVPGAITGLVARMALRAAQRQAKSAGRRQARDLAWGSARLDDGADTELHEQVRHEVSRLDETYLLPVLLHYYQGLSTLETAQALGISHSAARTRLSRAVEKLRHELQSQGRLLAMPALLALLLPERGQAVPPTLAPQLLRLAATVPAPAAGGLAGVMVSAVTVKLSTAVLVVGVAVVGSVLLQLAPSARKSVDGMPPHTLQAEMTPAAARRADANAASPASFRRHAAGDEGCRGNAAIGACHPECRDAPDARRGGYAAGGLISRRAGAGSCRQYPRFGDRQSRRAGRQADQRGTGPYRAA